MRLFPLACLAACLACSAAAPLSRTSRRPQLVAARSYEEGPAASGAVSVNRVGVVAASWRTVELRWRLLCAAVVRMLLIDNTRRGRDQRRVWVRAIAAVHPAVRFTALLLVLLLLHGLWVVFPRWRATAECVDLRLGALHLCGALLQLAIALALGGGAGLAVFLTHQRAAREEDKDAALTDEELAAACSSGAYCSSHEDRREELRRRGVESENWAVDERLTTDTVSVFVNWFTQCDETPPSPPRLDASAHSLDPCLRPASWQAWSSRSEGRTPSQIGRPTSRASCRETRSARPPSWQTSRLRAPPSESTPSTAPSC